MKTIKIAHLYYDLMNLYGENGNVRFLQRQLDKQGFKTEVHFLSLEDKIKFDKYDIFYIGTGSENNQRLVLNNLITYKNDILKAFKDGKWFIATGNALELFGKEIRLKDGNVLPTLNLFDFVVNEEEFRIVGEQLYSCNLTNSKIIGFQNRCSTIHEYDKFIFNVIDGTGVTPNNPVEGIFEDNFLGTYLLGPLLVRNPKFCDYLVKKICDNYDVPFIENKDTTAYKAYDEYLNNFIYNQK